MKKIVPLDWEKWIDHDVQIYRNLANHQISVQVKQSGKGWRVVGHTLNLVLRTVTFPVHETKRQYLITVRRKRDVCAFAAGTLVRESWGLPATNLIEIDFNPFLHGYFFEKGTEKQLFPCDYLVVLNGRVYATVDALIVPQQPALVDQPSLLNVRIPQGFLPIAA